MRISTSVSLIVLSQLFIATTALADQKGTSPNSTPSAVQNGAADTCKVAIKVLEDQYDGQGHPSPSAADRNRGYERAVYGLQWLALPALADANDFLNHVSPETKKLIQEYQTSHLPAVALALTQSLQKDLGSSKGFHPMNSYPVCLQDLASSTDPWVVAPDGVSCQQAHTQLHKPAEIHHNAGYRIGVISPSMTVMITTENSETNDGATQEVWEGGPNFSYSQDKNIKSAYALDLNHILAGTPLTMEETGLALPSLKADAHGYEVQLLTFAPEKAEWVLENKDLPAVCKESPDAAPLVQEMAAINQLKGIYAVASQPASEDTDKQIQSSAALLQ